MVKKNILIITDSLGKPRMYPEIIKYNEVWNVMLKEQLSSQYNVIILPRSGMSSNLLKIYSDEISVYEPEIVLVQVGIVDCAPRVLRKLELEALKRTGKLGEFAHKIIKKKYKEISTFRNISYTSQNQFQKNVENFFTKVSKTSQVYFIEILKPSSIYMNKSPLIKKRIKDYNSILSDILGDNLIKPFAKLSITNIDDFVMSDGHHLNKEGNIYLSNYILKNYFKNSNI